MTALRDEADMVITNPLFSKLREYVAWLMDGGVEFSMIGPKNAITYKEIFPLIKDNKIWLGRGFHRGNAYFRVPEAAENDYAEGVYDPEEGTVHFRNVDWFTNIDHGRRHEPLDLMTMEQNLRFGPKIVVENGYQEYVNYDAIEVPRTIPNDYDGLMGVPISFLDRHNPDQFEIVGASQELAKRMSDIAPKGSYVQGGPRFYTSNGDGTYRRIFERLVIRHKRTDNED